MGLLRATISLEMKSGAPEDRAVNTMHLDYLGDLTPARFESWGAKIATFYNGIGAYLSPSVVRGLMVHSVQFATVSMGTDGAADDSISSVLYTTHFGSAMPEPASTQGLPAEVAACLSYRGNMGALHEEGVPNIRPKSRHRGRMYLGPLNVTAMQTDATTGYTNVHPNFRTAALLVFGDFVTAINGPPEEATFFVIYSRANAERYPITLAHMDAAPDTMRTRGIKSVGRETWAINQEPAWVAAGYTPALEPSWYSNFA